MRVGEAIADAVAAEGVEVAFGLVGEGNIAVAQPLAERGDVEWFSARREDAVVSMADGYVRRSGADAGFATVTCGPGLTNATTAIIEAAKAGTPLVVLTGDTPAREHLHPQAVDERSFALAAHAGVHTVRAPETAVEDVEIAFRQARREQRPVVLILPVDHADEPYRGLRARAGGSRRPVPAARPGPTPEDVEAVVAALRVARRPVILAGRGAVLSEAKESLETLAETLRIPLLTTLRARGLFAGHTHAVGMVGGFPDGTANEALQRADLVLAFGTSLSDQTTRSGALVEDRDVVLFDLEPAASAARVRHARLVVADARAASEALLDAIRREGLSAARAEPTDAARSGHAAATSDSFDAGALARALDRLAPRSRNVVVDLGYFTSEACRFVSVDAPRRFVYTVNFGSIGLSIAAAAGVSIADPHVPTLALVGDGGLMMSIGELETIGRYGLPVAVLVFDDSALGIEYHALRLRGGDPDLVAFPDVDFAGVARAFGLDASTVHSVDELEALLDGRSWAGPLLVDARIDGTVETGWLGELVAGGWHARENA